jgi:hypothetical protein
MARLIYWSLYKLEMGPLGPITLKLAPRIWLASSRRRASLKPLIGSGGLGQTPQPVRAHEERLCS